MTTPMTLLEHVRTLLVGVDVTAHKEERRVATEGGGGWRVRYYVELVVGPVRENHARLGFSGTFKALLQLHDEFTALARQRQQQQQQLEHDPLSRRSLASADPLPPLLAAFPTSNHLLVKLQGRHVESDEKSQARAEALFAYYTELFNSEDRDLFLTYVAERAEREAPPRLSRGDNQQDAGGGSDGGDDSATHDEWHGRGPKGFFKRLFSKKSPEKTLRETATRLDKRLEFARPQYVMAKSRRQSEARR